MCIFFVLLLCLCIHVLPLCIHLCRDGEVLVCAGVYANPSSTLSVVLRGTVHLDFETRSFTVLDSSRET